MRVSIAAESQEEFESKRADVIKAISGSRNKTTTPTIPYFKAQGEMLEHWDAKFRQMLSDLKKDIDGIIE